MQATDSSNHGKFGYHLRTLKEFVELDPTTKKYHLTHRGEILDSVIQDFRFITPTHNEYEEYVQQLEPGDHAMGCYETEQFRHKISFPYLKAGLSKGEAVFHVVSEQKLYSEIRELKRYMVDTDYLVPKGALTIESSDEWFMKKGKGQPETIIVNLRKIAQEKRKAGFSGTRGAVEMGLMFDYDSSKLMRLESMLGRQFGFSFCGFCLFETNRLGSKQFAQLCKCHGHLISKGILGKTILGS